MKRPEKLNSALILGNLTTHPANPTNGMQYYNITDNKFYRYENNSWKDYVESSTLNNYYTKSQIDNLLSNKSNVGHTHNITDIINLATTLASLQNKYLFSKLSNPINTTSANSWVDTGLTVTFAEAGNYFTMFSGSLFCEGGGSTVGETRFMLDNVDITDSVRQTANTTVMVLGLIGGNSINSSGSELMTMITVSSGQVLKVQYRLGGSGTKVTMNNRSLFAFKM